MTNWASLLTIGYGYRVHVEERALCADLGGAYQACMQHTWRFVPVILALRELT